MKLILPILLIAGLTITACNNRPEYTPNEVNNFNYSMVKEVVIESTRSASNVDVIDNNGKIIAQNVSVGKSIVMGKNTSYTTRTATAGASTVYFPNENDYAYMWIEDEFPNSGDYDMNDVVFEFKLIYDLDPLTMATNAIRLKIKPIASGSKKQDIGLALIFNGMVLVDDMGNITGVDNTTFSNGLFKTIVNGIEEGSEQGSINGSVVIPITGNFRSHFTGINPSETSFINTMSNLNTHEGNEFEVVINLKKSIEDSDLTLFSANPDKLVNLSLFAVFNDRTKEVHLRGGKPSKWYDEANSKYFNSGSTFADKTNKVWAIMVPYKTPYAIERTSVTDAFPQFESWVTSNGETNKDWFNSPDPTLIFSGK